jgi:hypothetical protein
MTATISQVSAALMDALSGISGLRTKDYQPDAPQPPMAYPVLEQVTYHMTMGSGGVVQMDYRVNVLTGRWTDRTAHALLDSYLANTGASSIRSALEADKTLGGVVQQAVVSSAANLSSVSYGEQEFLEIQFQVTIHA